MITWGALLVLQGVVEGVGMQEGKIIATIAYQKITDLAPSDLSLVQGHLNTLRSTHQPEPSLRHRLANRLESAMQNMHTPPSDLQEFPTSLENSDLDSSWAIFDRNNLRLASPSWFRNEHLPQSQTPPRIIPPVSQIPQVESKTGTWTQYEAQAVPPQQMSDEINGNWDYYGQYNDTWTSTFLRLFGNDDSSQAESAMM